jgi:hypothetical protein
MLNRLPSFVNTAHEYEPNKYSAHKIRDVFSAEKELRSEYGDTAIFMSALRYGENPPSRESEEYGDLYLDFDSEDAEESKLDCLKVVRYFTEDLDLDEQHINIFYSGSKGYHVLINACALGVKPTPYLRNIYKCIATFLRDHLDLKTLDMSIYSFGRLFRVPNSKHAKTGRHKIWLPLNTLAKRSHDYIQHLSLLRGNAPPRFLNVESPNPEHLAFFQKYREYHQKSSNTTLNHVGFHALPEELIAALPEGTPICIKDMLERFIVSGRRHETQARIITYFKSVGMDEDLVLQTIMDKVEANYPPSRLEEVEFKLKTALRTIYDSDQYSFSCAFARSLTSAETDPDKKVQCEGSQCALFIPCGNHTRRGGFKKP